MTVTPSRFLLVASALCFAVALLASIDAVTASPAPWGWGGALALVLSFLA